ncbi:MAG: VOC family protein [Bacteroidota bacterium]
MAYPIDHIVCAVPDLDAAVQQLTTILGIDIVPGGKHPDQGTHNALFGLGDGIYFEVLAVDHENTAVAAPRWMGIDFIQDMRITRWALKSHDAAADAAQLGRDDLTSIHQGSRRKTDGSLLQWELSLPLAEPEVEVLPFFVDWGSSVHPTESLPQQAKLKEMEILHPQPKHVAGVLAQFGFAETLTESKHPRLRFLIETPKGEFWLE